MKAAISGRDVATKTCLEAVTSDLLLPGRTLASDYLGQPAWRRANPFGIG